jgi:hypothetical protein
VGSIVLANGLYSLSAAAMTLTLLRRGPVSGDFAAAGAVTSIAGLTLSFAGSVESQWLVEAATGPTIVGFSVWGLLAARAVQTIR